MHERRTAQRRRIRRIFACSCCKQLTDVHLPGHKIVLGDFSEWTKGLASGLVHTNFRTAVGGTPRGTQTYPGLLPMLRLDHIYFDRELELRNAGVHRSRTALLASDHLPLNDRLAKRCNLRHVFCTRLSWGAPDAVVQKAMRHSSPETKRHYQLGMVVQVREGTEGANKKPFKDAS